MVKSETLWKITLQDSSYEAGKVVVASAATAKQAIEKAERELSYPFPAAIYSVEMLARDGYLIVDKSAPIHVKDYKELGRID